MASSVRVAGLGGSLREGSTSLTAQQTALAGAAAAGAQSWQTFDPDGRLADEMVAKQLRELGAEVVRAARQFQADGTRDYADEVQFSPGEFGVPAAMAGGRP